MSLSPINKEKIQRMEILREADRRLIEQYSALGPFKGKLRPLAFLVKFKEEDGDFLRIYNVLTGGALRLREEELKTEEKFLAASLFLVPEDFDEYAFVDELRLYYYLKNSAKQFIGNFFIYPTTGCNARCFYCFEEGIKPRIMSRETALKTAGYIISHAGKNPVRIKWFGGEPAMCLDVIRLISEKLGEAGVSFTSKMNTNGYLLNEENIRILRDICMLRTVQIPVDGMGEDYDLTKNYVGVPKECSPWEKIIANVESLLKAGIQVDIRLNIGMHNKDKIPEILEFLIGKYKQYEKFTIFPQVLNEGGQDFYAEDERNVLFEVQKEAYKKCVGEGITISQNRYSLPSLKLHSCFADDGSWVGISPEGRIHKCPENINNENYFACLGEETTDQAKMDMYYEVNSWDECRKCAFYPSCVNLKECVARQKKCLKCHRDFRKWKTEQILSGL